MAIYDYDSGYLSSAVVLCITLFASFHRRVRGLRAKRWAATVFGFVVMSFVMGHHTWHHVLAVISCIFLIKWTGWRKCHLVSMAYLFTYMLAFRLADPTVRNHNRMEVNLHQMLTILKLIGVAYDIHLTHRNREKKTKGDVDETPQYADEDPIHPDFMELFHYTFSYIGMVVGPYVRYRTYDDYLKLPFAGNSQAGELLKNRILHVFVSVAGCKLISYNFPVEYIVTEEFRRRHFFYKNVFNFLHLLRFKMWMTSGLYMAQCITSIVGVGAYPTSVKSICTHGPTEDYSHLKNISQEEAAKMEYDFETINTLDLWKIHRTPWQSEFWRYWNRTVQYWMGNYIHKELLDDPALKDYRVVITMFISAYWHGIELGYYTSLVLAGFYIMAEKPYHKIYQYTSGWGSTAFSIAMWIIHAHIFGHLMMSFIVLQPSIIFTHAAAMNYVPYISLVFFYLFGKLTLSYLQKDDRGEISL